MTGNIYFAKEKTDYQALKDFNDMGIASVVGHDGIHKAFAMFDDTENPVYEESLERRRDRVADEIQAEAIRQAGVKTSFEGMAYVVVVEKLENRGINQTQPRLPPSDRKDPRYE